MRISSRIQKMVLALDRKSLHGRIYDFLSDVGDEIRKNVRHMEWVDQGVTSHRLSLMKYSLGTRDVGTGKGPEVELWFEVNPSMDIDLTLWIGPREVGYHRISGKKNAGEIAWEALEFASERYANFQF